MVRDLTAAVRLGDLDPLHPVPVLAHRQVPGLRAAALRVDGPVLEEERDIGDLAVAPRPREALLERQTVGVRKRARADDPELGCRGQASALAVLGGVLADDRLTMLVQVRFDCHR